MIALIYILHVIRCAYIGEIADAVICAVIVACYVHSHTWTNCNQRAHRWLTYIVRRPGPCVCAQPYCIVDYIVQMLRALLKMRMLYYLFTMYMSNGNPNVSYFVIIPSMIKPMFQQFNTPIIWIALMVQWWIGYMSSISLIISVTIRALIERKPERLYLIFTLVGLFVVSAYYDIRNAAGTEYELGTYETHIIGVRMLMFP